MSTVLVVMVLRTVSPVWAGDWHHEASLICSDCHTQHNSQAGAPMRTDNDPNPADKLLLRETPLELCVSCHDGANASAPDVISPISYVAETSGGEFPNSGGTGTAIAHNLNNPVAEIPPGGTIPMVLVCTTCHDPHGNENYRNLRPDPTLTGLPDVTVTATQTVIANGSNPAAVYVPSNVIYKVGMSLWCQQCHGPPLPGSDHPDDTPIFGSVIADYPTWLAVTLPRVPTDSPDDDVIPSTDDEVICLSCHRAHGTPNASALLYADGVTMDSTCEECHNQ